jgi:dTDP-4-dehydrorhamnose 3,5-epimerase
MQFNKTPLAGAYLVKLKKIEDERGFFARSWCREDFEVAGLNPNIAQCNLAWNARAGTLRGLHFQVAPHAEAKLVRCTRGEIYDVAVDLRPDSPTHKGSFGVTLTAENYLMLYIPEGFGHGYQTLTDDAEVSYMTTHVYTPYAARGWRYDDPAFGIKWPLPVSVISEADRNWKPYYIHLINGRNRS